jgi:hypothetical protein
MYATMNNRLSDNQLIQVSAFFSFLYQYYNPVSWLESQVKFENAMQLADTGELNNVIYHLNILNAVLQ